MAKKKATKSVDAPVADKAVKEPAAKKSRAEFASVVKTIGVTCSGSSCRIIGVDKNGGKVDSTIPCDGSVKVSIGA